VKRALLLAATVLAVPVGVVAAAYGLEAFAMWLSAVVW
jgi:hypothetical protein